MHKMILILSSITICLLEFDLSLIISYNRTRLWVILMKRVSSKKDIFKEVSLHLKNYCMITDIGEITWLIEHYAPVECSKKFDEYTIEEFLIMYKIGRLFDLGVVSKKEAVKLKELYDLKLLIDSKIGDEHRKEIDNFNIYEPNKTRLSNPRLEELKKKSEQIDNLLVKYHLTPEDFELENIFDNLIKSENYNNSHRTEEIENIIKKIKLK